MPQLSMITVPGLEVPSDWAAVHDRLLDDFPTITDVLATTLASTVVIVYDGREEVGAWLASVGDAILSRQLRAGDRRFVRTDVNTTRGANVQRGPKAIVSVDGRRRAG